MKHRLARALVDAICVVSLPDTAVRHRDNGDAVGMVHRRARPESEARTEPVRGIGLRSPPVSGDLKVYVTQHAGVWDRALADRLWVLYEVAYHPISEAVVSREVLRRTEFDDVLRDPTFRIWLLWDGEEPIGMCVIATDLTHSRYLSLAYFESRYPNHARNGTVHYIYWVVVHPGREARGAIVTLARECLALEAEDGVLLVFDTPQTNERSPGGGFVRMMERLAQMVGAAAPVQLLEVQRYYAIDLSEARLGDFPLDTSELDFVDLP